MDFLWHLFYWRRIQNYLENHRRRYQPAMLQDGALVAAWRYFVDCDTSGTQRRNTDRLLQLSVIYLASALAVLVVLLVEYSPLQEIGSLILSCMALVLLLLATYSFLRSQTSANAEYYAYRLAEALVGREIFLYRLRAGRYLAVDDARERQRLLTQSIKAIEERIKQMGIRPASSIVESDEDLWAFVVRQTMSLEQAVAYVLDESGSGDKD